MNKISRVLQKKSAENSKELSLQFVLYIFMPVFDRNYTYPNLTEYCQKNHKRHSEHDTPAYIEYIQRYIRTDHHAVFFNKYQCGKSCCRAEKKGREPFFASEIIKQHREGDSCTYKYKNNICFHCYFLYISM